MNKEIYESPEMEIVVFEGADVITTSGDCVDYNRQTIGGNFCLPGYLTYLADGSCANRIINNTSVGCANNEQMFVN